MMAPLFPVTYSWIALTTLVPLSSLLLLWTIVSIHRKHVKSILLLSVVYLQLFFQLFNFCHSTLALLKLNYTYVYYLNYIFAILVAFKSLAVLSSHFEQFYKVKYPSNYLLNVNSSLLKYHLLVLFLLSLMLSYLFRNLEFIPIIRNPNNPGFHSHSSFEPTAAETTVEKMFGDKFELVIVFLIFHCIIIMSSLGFVVFKVVLHSKSSCASRNSSLSSLDINIIGTNSTSSSANLFGSSGSNSGIGNFQHELHRSSGLVQSRTITAVCIVNLMINLTLVVCAFSNFWLPSALSSWPLSNLITWSQVIESLITPIVYCLKQVQVHYHKPKKHSSYTSTSGSSRSNNEGSVTYQSNNNNHQLLNDRIAGNRLDAARDQLFQHNNRNHHHHALQFHNHRFPVTNGPLCFSNGEFQYFAGCKNSTAPILNNASAYNTFDSSVNQTMRSNYSKDSLRCASVTTIANDDFEFLTRREEQLLHNNNLNNSINQIGLQSMQRQSQEAQSQSQSQQSTITVASTNEQQPSSLQNIHCKTSNNANLLQQYFQCINAAANHKNTKNNNNNLLNNYNNINHSFRQRTITRNNNSRNDNVDQSDEFSTTATAAIIPSSLSMNDLDLIVTQDEDDYDEQDGERSDRNNIAGPSKRMNNGRPLQLESLNNNTNSIANNKCKYKKNSNYCIKRRFTNSNNLNSSGSSSSNFYMPKGGLTRRVLSLESLHNTVNESHLAYLDTGERVIVFTTDYI